MKSLLTSTLAAVLTLFLLGCNSKSKLSIEANNKNERKIVKMVTNYGTITLELYNETPLHRDNFIKLINDKAYDSLLFHRVIENFMIQGGDPESKNASSEYVLGEGDLGYTVPAEFHPDFFHKKGALATAREETLNRESSAIQFYIVQGKVFNDSLLDHAQGRINNFLARHYTINDTLYQPLWNDLKNAAEIKNEELFETLDDSIEAIAATYTNFKKYTIPEAHRNIYKTIGGTPHLDQNYTVFGQVIEGLEVVDSIANTQTDERNRPVSDARILTVTLKN